MKLKYYVLNFAQFFFVFLTINELHLNNYLYSFSFFRNFTSQSLKEPLPLPQKSITVKPKKKLLSAKENSVALEKMEIFLKAWNIQSLDNGLKMYFKAKTRLSDPKDFPQKKLQKEVYQFKNKLIRILKLINSLEINELKASPYQNIYQLKQQLEYEKLKQINRLNISSYQKEVINKIQNSLILRLSVKIIKYNWPYEFEIFMPNLESQKINPLNLLSQKNLFVHNPVNAKKWDYFRFHFKTSFYYELGKDNYPLVFLNAQSKGKYLEKTLWKNFFNQVYEDIKMNLSYEVFKKKYGTENQLIYQLYKKFKIYMENHPHKNEKDNLIHIHSIIQESEYGKILVIVGKESQNLPHVLIQKLEADPNPKLFYYPKRSYFIYQLKIKNLDISDLPGFHEKNYHRMDLMNYLFSLGSNGFSKPINDFLSKAIENSDFYANDKTKKYYFYPYKYMNIKKVVLKEDSIFLYLPKEFIPVSYPNIIPF